MPRMIEEDITSEIMASVWLKGGNLVDLEIALEKMLNKFPRACACGKVLTAKDVLNSQGFWCEKCWQEEVKLVAESESIGKLDTFKDRFEEMQRTRNYVKQGFWTEEQFESYKELMIMTSSGIAVHLIEKGLKEKEAKQ